LNRTVVLRYRSSYLEARLLATATINLRLGAVRRLAYETADSGLLSSDMATGIRRVKGVRNLGVRMGNWLTVDQSLALGRAPDSNQLKGKRDRALLTMACLWSALPESRWPQNLTSGSPGGTLGHRHLKGKAGHVRTVPVRLGNGRVESLVECCGDRPR
jgi:hypothetical protein